MSKQDELDNLLAKLQTLRNRAELAYSVGDFDKAKEFGKEAHDLAQKCQALLLEIEIGEMENG